MRGWSIQVAWVPGAAVASSAESGSTVVIAGRRIALGVLPVALQDALSRFDCGVPLSEVEQIALDAGGALTLAQWLVLRRRLEGSAAVTYTLRAGGRVRAVFAPSCPGPALDFDERTGAVRLSRFAFVRRVRGATVLDSPLARGTVQLCDSQSLSMLFDDLAPGAMPTDVADSPSWRAGLTRLVRAANLLLDVESDGSTVEDRDPVHRSWEFADLLLHMRSRSPRRDRPSGGTFPWRGIFDPLPALKPSMSDDRIRLASPRQPTQASHDAVVDGRRSLRSQADAPMSAESLGHFLWRSARAVDRDDEALGRPYPVVHRIYPGGGACYPLEVYLVIRACDGIAPGLYHYAVADHCLERLGLADNECEELSAQYAWMMPERALTQVLCIICARFLRTAWKYQSIAYALTLKEVGVLYESMYLAASAGGLAACAVGTGVGPRFSALIGADPLAESPVGEFIVGRHA